MRVQLRKLQYYHLEKVMHWRMSPEVTRYMLTDPVLTLQKQREWFDGVSNDPTAKYWVITYDEEWIGLASITNINRVEQTCKKGYYIGELGYRGKGIASLLEYNMYEYVFNCLDLHKVDLEVLAFNVRALAIYQKFGCEIKEVIPGRVTKNGEKIDVIKLELLKSKWEKIRARFALPSIFIESY